MSGRTLAWSAPLPSVFSAQMLRACGASAFWRRGIWSGEERGASALLQPVTLGEPLNSSVFSFFNLPSRGKKKTKSIPSILKDQSVKLLGNSLN